LVASAFDRAPKPSELILDRDRSNVMVLEDSVDMALGSARQPVLGIALNDKKIRNSPMRCWRPSVNATSLLSLEVACWPVIGPTRKLRNHFLRQQNCGLTAR